MSDKQSSQPRIPASDALDDVIDQLLPVPDDGEPGEPTSIADKIDIVVPVPERISGPLDDASTREELEVDTSADGIDDIISVSEG